MGRRWALEQSVQVIILPELVRSARDAGVVEIRT